VAATPQLLDSFRARLDQFARELPGVEQGSVEALHQARVASRRLRELLPVLGLEHDAARKLRRQLRKVTRRLGTVRELDVLVPLIDEYSQRGKFASTALRRLRRSVEQKRQAAREHLDAKLPTRKLERLVARLERAAKSAPPADVKERRSGVRPAAQRSRRAPSWALDARLARRAADVRNAIAMAGALYAPEPLHDVRITIKKLRYAAELSHETGARLTAEVNALKAAQDLLGRLHDCEVLVASGRELQASLFPPDLSTWRGLNLLVHAVEDDCRQMHARYMRDRARLLAIADRLGANRPSASDKRAAG
jgi:CHAD domain-containing protein